MIPRLIKSTGIPTIFLYIKWYYNSTKLYLRIKPFNHCFNNNDISKKYHVVQSLLTRKQPIGSVAFKVLIFNPWREQF